MISVGEVLLRRRDDDNLGLVFLGDGGESVQSWTWRAVVSEAAVRAEVLRSLRRDGRPFHVGVLLENTPDFVFLLGAAALTGATIVGINPTRRGRELAEDIRHTDCQLVVTEERQVGLLDGLDLGLSADRVLVVESDRWSELLASHAGAVVPSVRELPGPDALFILIFTSGSSGAPKAVRASQGRMAATADMGFRSSDVLYCAMPLFHGNALVANLIPGMGAGATIVLRRRFSASGFLPEVRRHGVTYFNSVGRAVSHILATPPTAEDRDHRVRVALAPETSRPDIAAFEARFGIPVFEGYGSSEGAIHLLPVPSAAAGALGRAEADVELAVVDAATGEECPLALLDSSGRLLNGGEAIGELVRRDSGAASSFEGYYKNPDADAERTRNGWFWSGDLAYRDADGIFYFAGRTIDWLRVDGENFAAAPVERILGRHPRVRAVAVYAVPDPRTGDRVMAAVELRDGAEFSPTDFASFLESQPDLGPKWWPRFVRVTPALPNTATNKVAKQALRSIAWLTTDPVWWQPEPGAPYVPFRPADATSLTAEFESHHRVALLPSG
jgi:fatty-acyl-CoA synthase